MLRLFQMPLPHGYRSQIVRRDHDIVIALDDSIDPVTPEGREIIGRAITSLAAARGHDPSCAATIEKTLTALREGTWPAPTDYLRVNGVPDTATLRADTAP